VLQEALASVSQRQRCNHDSMICWLASRGDREIQALQRSAGNPTMAPAAAVVMTAPAMASGIGRPARPASSADVKAPTARKPPWPSAAGEVQVRRNASVPVRRRGSFGRVRRLRPAATRSLKVLRLRVASRPSLGELELGGPVVGGRS